MRDLKGLWRFPGDFLQTFFKWYGATLVIAANYTARPAQPRGCPIPTEPCEAGLGRLAPRGHALPAHCRPQLAQKNERNPTQPRILLTELGVGYRLAR